jgi:GMP synthase-like glutamine amidotransferase
MLPWKYVKETIFEAVVIVGLCLGAAFLIDYLGKKYHNHPCGDTAIQTVKEVKDGRSSTR